MNYFIFSKYKDTPEKEKVEISLSPNIHDMIIGALKENWQMEILQGERKEMADGMIYYCFYIHPEDAQLLKNAFLNVYTKIEGYNSPN